MPKIRIPRPFAAIAFAAAVACNADPLVLCACSMPGPYSIVYGNVTAPTGQAVPGAAVRVEVGPPDCQSVAASFDGNTDATGRYRAGISRYGEFAEQCIRVFAMAPTGSGYRNSDTTQFALAAPTRAGADSVRRDVALRAP